MKNHNTVADIMGGPSYWEKRALRAEADLAASVRARDSERAHYIRVTSELEERVRVAEGGNIEVAETSDDHTPHKNQHPQIMTADIVWCNQHQRYEYFR